MTIITTTVQSTNSMSETIISQSLIELKNRIETTPPTQDDLEVQLINYVKKGQEDCVKYILEYGVDLNNIYYSLLYYSCEMPTLNLIQLFVKHAPEDIYMNNNDYLSLLLGGFSTGKYDACLLLLETFFMKNEYIQEYLNEFFSTIIRIDALTLPGMRKSKDQLSNEANALETLLQLGAKYDPTEKRRITPRMQQIVNSLILKQKITIDLANNTTKDTKHHNNDEFKHKL